jgi:hypothetical protein
MLPLLLGQISDGCANPGASPERDGITCAITFYQRVIFLHVRVNDTPDLLFLLDTGASASALDAVAAEALELPLTGSTQVEGTAGVVNLESVRIEELAVGELSVQGITATDPRSERQFGSAWCAPRRHPRVRLPRPIRDENRLCGLDGNVL